MRKREKKIQYDVIRKKKQADAFYNAIKVKKYHFFSSGTIISIVNNWGHGERVT